MKEIEKQHAYIIQDLNDKVCGMVKGDAEKIIDPLLNSIKELESMVQDTASALVELTANAEFSDIRNSESAFRRALFDCKNAAYAHEIMDGFTRVQYGDIKASAITTAIANAGKKNNNNKKRTFTKAFGKDALKRGPCRFGKYCKKKATCLWTHDEDVKEKENVENKIQGDDKEEK
eukprot:425036_1